MYAGSLLTGQWYETLIDPVTLHLPPSYTLDIFLDALTAFFGSGATLASRERALDVLRQTCLVSDLAIAFLNITNTFTPRWTDHSLIYVFTKNLKEFPRFEVAARGNVPTSFQDYIAVAISVENNQAAAVQGRSQQSGLPPRLPLPPPRPQALVPAPPYAGGAVPMDLDGSRGPRVVGPTLVSAPIAGKAATSLPPVQLLYAPARPGAPSSPLPLLLPHPVIPFPPPVIPFLPLVIPSLHPVFSFPPFRVPFPGLGPIFPIPTLSLGQLPLRFQKTSHRIPFVQTAINTL